MKKFNKKIIMSVLTLVLTVIALGTTTFAWFSLSTVSKISNIEGTVTGGDGLEIRLVAIAYDESGNPLSDENTAKTNWMANLDKTDVATFINDIFGGKKFDAVTTLAPNSYESFTKMGTDNVTGDMILNHNAEANTDYIEFRVEFRSQAEGTVALSSLDFDGSEVENYPIYGAEYLQYEGQGTHGAETVETSPAYAARVSFDQHVVEHKAEAFDNGVNGNHAGQLTAVEHGQYSFLTKSKGIILLDALEEEIEVSDLSSINLAPAYQNNAIQTGETYHINKVLEQEVEGVGFFEGFFDVRIWIEGWDADAYDSIFNGTLVVSMEFRKEQ